MTKEIKETTAWVWRMVRWGLVGTASLVICYLALRASPEIQTIPWMPRVVGGFLAQNDFLANLLGFVTLTLIVQAAFSGWSRPSLVRFGWRVMALSVMVVGLEWAQLFLPRRNFDVKDMLAGLAGVAMASWPWLLAPAKSQQTGNEGTC